MRFLVHLSHRQKHREIAKMRRHRNIFLIKEQKISEKELNETERNNLPDEEFKTLFIRCSTN